MSVDEKKMQNSQYVIEADISHLPVTLFKQDELDRINGIIEKFFAPEYIEMRNNGDGRTYTLYCFVFLLLLQPLNLSDPLHPPAGGDLIYLNTSTIISTLNHIFGTNGWSRHVRMSEMVLDEKIGERFKVTFRVIVSIRLRDGTTHSDVGYGTLVGPNRDMLMENAEKSAFSDALKRASHGMGNLFACVYHPMYQAFVFGELSKEDVDTYFGKDRLFKCDTVLIVKFKRKRDTTINNHSGNRHYLNSSNSNIAGNANKKARQMTNYNNNSAQTFQM